MEDNAIIDLYWTRSENAISQTAVKYGAYCYTIAYNILSNREEYPGEGLWFFQEDYDGDGLLDLAVFYQGAFRALHRLDEQGREIWQWKPREGFWFYETGYQNFQQTAYECYLPGYSFEEGNLQYHVFLRIESDGLKIRDCLRFDAAKGEWSRADTGILGVPFSMPVAEQISNWKPVSGEEYGKLLAAY